MKELNEVLSSIESSFNTEHKGIYSKNGLYVFLLDFDENCAASEQLQKTGHQSDFYSFVLIKQGELTVRVNLKETTYRKNDLLILTPESHKYFVNVAPKTLVEIIAFSSKFLSKINLPGNFVEVFDYMASKYAAIWSLSASDVCVYSGLFNQLQNRVRTNNTSFANELLYHSFMLFIYEMANLGKAYSKREKQHFSRKEIKIIEFHNLLKKHFRKERSVKFYADLLCLSPKYLSETTKEITKLTAGEIIDSSVILEAKILLDNPKLSISEIAQILNFSDQSFFGKYFKRHVGHSPKAYRHNR